MDDLGQWQFDFDHTYNDTMQWSEYLDQPCTRQRPPDCTVPESIGWLNLGQTEGSTPAGASDQITVEVGCGNAG